MASPLELAQIVALLRASERPWSHYSETIEEHGSALPALEERGLLAAGLAEAELRTVASWADGGTPPVTVLDPGYPENLRAVHDRPPLMFIAGDYASVHSRSVAVVGSREATREGVEAARALSAHLSATGFTVVSGLARGIDAAAHGEALRAGAPTVAVIGTGIARVYPAEHAQLQAEVAAPARSLPVLAAGAAVADELPVAQRGHVGRLAGDGDRRGQTHERCANPGATRAAPRPSGVRPPSPARPGVGTRAGGTPRRLRL